MLERPEVLSPQDVPGDIEYNPDFPKFLLVSSAVPPGRDCMRVAGGTMHTCT